MPNIPERSDLSTQFTIGTAVQVGDPRLGRLNWEDWYTRDVAHAPSLARQDEIARRHAQFFDLIERGMAAEETTRVIEVGVGTGRMYRTLQERHADIVTTALDIDADILRGTKRADRRAVPASQYVMADSNDLPFPASQRDRTVIFHQGMLEHYDDEDVEALLREQLRVARTVYVSVPSIYYNFTAGLRGDERLFTLEQWTERVTRLGFTVEEAFYYGEFEGEECHIALAIVEPEAKY